MKKFILALLASLLVLVLCGCVKVDINVGIDPDNNVTLVYSIKADASEIDANNLADASKTFDQLNEHFLSHGFTTEYDTLSLIATYKMHASSYDEAYEMLKKILSNEELSIFTQVSVEKTENEYEQGYFVGLKADYSEWLEGEGIKNLPFELKESVQKYFDQPIGTLTLSLASDGSVTEGAVQSGKMTTISTNILLNAPINLELTARISGDGANRTGMSAASIIGSEWIAVVALSVVCAGLIAVSVVLIVKRKKAHSAF